MGQADSRLLQEIVDSTNFSKDEVERLRKRFMKLDKVGIGLVRRQS